MSLWFDGKKSSCQLKNLLLATLTTSQIYLPYGELFYTILEKPKTHCHSKGTATGMLYIVPQRQGCMRGLTAQTDCLTVAAWFTLLKQHRAQQCCQALGAWVLWPWLSIKSHCSKPLSFIPFLSQLNFSIQSSCTDKDLFKEAMTLLLQPHCPVQRYCWYEKVKQL